MSSFEKKFGKYAISNLSLYLIICYGFGYMISFVNSGFLSYLTLDPIYILHGQIWRLFTWVVVPPYNDNIFFVLITLYFYYSIGSSLERIWGTYRYNCYIFGGFIFTILGSFLLYGIYALSGMPAVSMGDVFSTYYVNMSIFLAFAATFPEMQVLLMFVVPIKVKCLGIIYGIYLVFLCLMGGPINWIIIGSSLLNFVVFYISTHKKLKNPARKTFQKEKQQQMMKKKMRITRHKCAICGRTEESNPELEFRFCSKCNGNYEYCQDHLFTHQHIE